MKATSLAALVAISSLLLLPTVASADLSWDLDLFLTEGGPSGPAPWAKVTIENVGDEAGDAFDDVKFTFELFLSGASEFVSQWKFNLDPTLDPENLSATYISGDQPDNADFVTNEDKIAAGPQGKADFEWRWPTSNADDRFKGSEAVMYYVSYAGRDLTSADFEFFATKSDFANTLARVQGIDSESGSAWIANNPEPSSAVLAMFAVGILGLRSRRGRKSNAAAA